MIEKVVKVYADMGYNPKEETTKYWYKVVNILKIYESAGCEINYALIAHIISIVKHKEKYQSQISMFLKEALDGNSIAQKIVIEYYEDKVIKVASNYINKGYDFDELVNEGILKIYDSLTKKPSSLFFNNIIQRLHIFYMRIVKDKETISYERTYQNLDSHEKKKYIDNSIMEYNITEEDILSRISAENIKDYLKDLPDEKHQRIIEKRFGLLTGEEMTLEAIGKEENLTKERVRIIVDNCLVILKNKIIYNERMAEVNSQIKDSKVKTLENYVFERRFNSFFDKLGYDLFTVSFMLRQIDNETKERLIIEIGNYDSSSNKEKQIISKYPEVLEKLDDIKKQMQFNSKKASLKKAEKEERIKELKDFILFYDFDEVNDITFDMKLLVTKLYLGILKEDEKYSIAKISRFLKISKEEVQQYIYDVIQYCNTINDGIFDVCLSYYEDKFKKTKSKSFN